MEIGLVDKKGRQIKDTDILVNTVKQEYSIYFSNEHQKWYTFNGLFRAPLTQMRAIKLKIKGL